MNKLRALTRYELARKCPSAFAMGADPKVSDKYLFESTLHALNLFEEQGWLPVLASQTGKGNTAKHMIVLQKFNWDGTPAHTGEYAPQIILITAHNGTCSYQLRFGIYRFVCSNGLMVGSTIFKPIRIVHLKVNAQTIKEAIASFEAKLPEVEAILASMRGTELTMEQQVELARAAVKARWGSFDKAPKSFGGPTQLLAAHRTEDVGNDVWRVYNRIQENIINPGGRMRSLRAIDSVTKVNTELWDAAANLAMAA